MRWAMTGHAALAVAQTQTAYAGLQDSDVWIGLPDQLSGFLLDEATGDLWMTGTCLKPLARADQLGSVWMSHTVELVSVGRGMATLDQRFELDVEQGEITVTSNGRGGAQSFSANIDRDRDCDQSGVCADLIATQEACQG